MPDGRYRYKYDEDGKVKYAYSWRLDHNDRMVDGKRKDVSLREKEKEIQANQFKQIATNGDDMTVLELVEKYIATKTGVKVRGVKETFSKTFQLHIILFQ